MYLNKKETAEYLDLPLSEIERLVQEGQIRFVRVEEEILINQNQFKLFLAEREKYKRELEEYLHEPIPLDPDIKDED